MRVFFATRRLCQQLQRQQEKELPLTNPNNSASEGDIVDLSEFKCRVYMPCVLVSLQIIVISFPVRLRLGISECHCL